PAAGGHAGRRPVHARLGDPDAMGPVHGATTLPMTRLPALRILPLALAGVLLAAACTSGGGPSRRQQGRPDGRLLQVGLPPALPDTTGWGVHVLGLARGADGALWAGTFGQGIYVL